MTTKTQSSSPSTTSSPQSKQSLHHVNFKTSDDNNKMNERKKRYLTAKYGQHQMNLIKKRLKVETWMYEQLQFLFDSDDNLNNIDIDLDEVLDLEGKIRKQWLREKLIDAKKSKELVEKFIVELLEKANTL
ncbi:hypothetical protein DERP_002405 [Dermatophagoides pteronyssinus]|uniref:Protein phosphatase 1 regulatory subunit 14B-like n=1 Tax=Dermatophagoides pteronyssinus TaxID=6956 RepID=A0ABQ8JI50_DERPT|nr:hypothetical protein DERP_002405 [Dermatophagoides pteronyssinus]